MVLPVCALKNFLSELGFSKPQKSDIAFSGMFPSRRSSLSLICADSRIAASSPPRRKSGLTELSVGFACSQKGRNQVRKTLRNFLAFII